MTWNIDEMLSSIPGEIVAVQPLIMNKAETYADARSAAFYALGKTIKNRASITLVVPGEYLSSTYTAITEAWFQKANVVVLALFEKYSDVKTSWMDRCVLQTATYGPEEQDSLVLAMKEARDMPGPALFNLVGAPVKEDSIEYGALLTALRAVAARVNVWLYNPTECADPYAHAIGTRDKYGILSRYIGMSTAMDEGVLICPASCALLDMNIFRTRYANGNMKIVLWDESHKLDDLNTALWIQSNGWECAEAEQADEAAYKWLMKQQRQAVLLIH